MSSLLLIGCGAMGGALLKGWLDSLLPLERIEVVDPLKQPSFSHPLLTWHSSLENFFKNPKAKEISSIVLAVKPQEAFKVLETLSPFLSKESLIISIAAGKTLPWLLEQLPKETPLIRAMPNLPALYKKGVTGMFANHFVTLNQKNFTELLFSAVGETMWLAQESHFDLITALSGGGPAYFCYITEILTQIAFEKGINKEDAAKLARLTFIGSAALLDASHEDPVKLREKVTSKGGTTFEALTVFKTKEALYTLLKQAIEAAMKRSKELSIMD